MLTSVVLLATIWTAPLLVSGPLPWLPPIDPPVVVNGFAPPPALEPWLPGHRGVDLAASDGQLVRAAGPGVVSFAGPVAGRGVVVIEHGPLRTTYEPVRASVAVGDPVTTGMPIGTLNQPPTGSHCHPACLHWGLIRGTTYLDPVSLLEPQTVRLLPFGDRRVAESMPERPLDRPAGSDRPAEGTSRAAAAPPGLEESGSAKTNNADSKRMDSNGARSDVLTIGATALSAGVVIPLAHAVRKRRPARPVTRRGGEYG